MKERSIQNNSKSLEITNQEQTQNGNHNQSNQNRNNR